MTTGDAPNPRPQPAPTEPAGHQTSIKETLTSLIIAFSLAFVFRGFVVEAFVIPTGSMAPTLLGAHMRFQNPDSGYNWPVAPWAYNDSEHMDPKAVQGHPGEGSEIIVHDPLTKQQLRRTGVERMGGDRIFVFKYLYSIFDPQRFDVVVFKNPLNPGENFIKRLVGLPGEQIAMIDGDVYARPADTRPPTATTWDEPGWQIQRKPERVQRAVWQRVFDSAFTPPGDFTPPWTPSGDGWNIKGSAAYTHAGDAPASLIWDDAGWPITDRYAYNEFPRAPEGEWLDGFQPDRQPTGGLPVPYMTAVYPVSDLRIALAIRPERAAVGFSSTIESREHVFTARYEPAGDASPARIVLTMRPTDGTPQEVAAATLDPDPFVSGTPVNFEFWHVDQTLQVWIDNTLIASAAYDWAPAERVRRSFGHSIADLISREGRGRSSVFSDSTIYRGPKVRIDFQPGSFTLHRVALDRDLFYQPHQRQPAIDPPAGSHPAFTKNLNPDQFFCCGDNSPESYDCRLWDRVDPWVAAQIDPTPGVVPRDLLIGKAFVVYFPSVQQRRLPVLNVALPVPDFGRMRFIF
jgi:signal peptidase I